MFLSSIFIVSGAVIALLVITKYLSERRKKTFLVLNLISKGDMHVRDLTHRATNEYSQLKGKTEVLVKKQIPLRTRSLFNRSNAYLRTRLDKHLAYVRNSKLINKSDGISDFFRNISNIEKGRGEINDYYNEEPRDLD